MAKFNNQQLANSFFFRGKRCIEDAKYLFEKRGSSIGHDLILVHGIELLLKSYLLLKGVKQSGHNYELIYNKCLDYGDELRDSKLKWLIGDLSKYFHKDTVAVRYVEESKYILFPADVAYPILEANLRDPIDSLRRIKKW